MSRTARRRTLITALIAVVCITLISEPFAAERTSPFADKPADDPAAGLLYAGLERHPDCGPLMFKAGEVDGETICTHGPDPAPKGEDVRVQYSAQELLDRATGDGATVAGMLQAEGGISAAAALAPGAGLDVPEPLAGISAADGNVSAQGNVICQGDGQSGQRIQLLYVYTTTNRLNTVAPAIAQAAQHADALTYYSAQRTGGSRRLRFVHDANCNMIVTPVQVPSSVLGSVPDTFKAVRDRGFTKAQRIYTLFVDSGPLCGVAWLRSDTAPFPNNINNGHNGAGFARIDQSCWTGPIVLHEIAHSLGSVITGSPNASGEGHCVDELDVMCLDGKPIVCSTGTDLLDCNNNDYFHTNPPAGSYLAKHVNIAMSPYLIGAPAVPPPTTTPPTTTARPTTKPPTTTAKPPPTTAKPTTTTARPTTKLPAPQPTTTAKPPPTTAKPTTTTRKPTTTTAPVGRIAKVSCSRGVGSMALCSWTDADKAGGYRWAVVDPQGKTVRSGLSKSTAISISGLDRTQRLTVKVSACLTPNSRVCSSSTQTVLAPAGSRNRPNF